MNKKESEPSTAQRRFTVSFDEPMCMTTGGMLRRLELALETYGMLNDRRDNAIMICHGLTGNQNAAGEPLPGTSQQPWWQLAIGPGLMFDTNRYFIVCANVPGGCAGSTGPATTDLHTGRPFGMRFPRITIADMADAGVRLQDYLGISSFLAVAGGCMGGFQALEFARRHPTRLSHVVAISATPFTSSYTIALWELMRQAIYADPAWHGGDYYGQAQGPLTGMGLGAMIGSVLWLDRDTLAEKFGRRRIDTPSAEGDLPPPTVSRAPEFAVEAFLARVRANASLRFDPNSLICLTKAMDLFDLADGYPNLVAGVSAIDKPVLLVSYESDWRYPRAEIARLADAIATNGTNVSHHHLTSRFGHGAYQFDVSELAPVVTGFLQAKS
ncbi:homoserine O-acetyltransferase [Paraburkholderia sp. EG285A]|uniref:homoserine O-acetyltransferase MetX n=1 Tax=Paraburkholderia sp. EG285A TaxID=3237009 RepID=UPI0034D2C026